MVVQCTYYLDSKYFEGTLFHKFRVLDFSYEFCILLILDQCRPVVPGSGSAGGVMAPPDFGRSVNPISTRGGGDYAHQIIITGTPGFSDLPTYGPDQE